MTVIERHNVDGAGCFVVEVSDESLSKTTMGTWEAGQDINLERALTGADELGGHLVTGHVDGLAEVLEIEEIASSHKLVLKAPNDLAFGIAPKGSITIDGISLTVNDVKKNVFAVNIIPHTWKVTTLRNLQIGDKVNLEIDLIARYVARYLENMKA